MNVYMYNKNNRQVYVDGQSWGVNMLNVCLFICITMANYMAEMHFFFDNLSTIDNIKPVI